MSRTSNQTLPYWQFEVGLFDDGKTIELSDKYGPLGEAILFRIMCYITQSDGYFAQLNNALILYVYRSIGNKWIKDRRIISEVIQYCGVCGLFDVNLLRQNVITSQGIQRRWLSAKKKSRAQGFLTTKYWLLGNEPLQGKTHNNADNCNNNADNCNNNADNCNNNADIKVTEGNVINIYTQEEPTDFETQFNAFCGRWNVTVDNYSPLLSELDFEKLNKGYEESTKFLQVAPVARTISWVIKNAASIYAGKYKDKKDSGGNTEKPKGFWDDKLDKLGRID